MKFKSSFKIIYLTILISTNSFAVDFWDPALPPQAVEKIQSDLNLMKSFQATHVSPLHQEIFGEMGKGYEDFFNERIKNIHWNPYAKKSKSLVAYKSNHEYTIVFTRIFLELDLSPLYRIGLYFHESRHMEASDPGHILCPANYINDRGEALKTLISQVPLAGLDACDSGYTHGYGVAAVFFLNIMNNCDNCSDETKREAEIFAQDALNRLPNKQDRDALLEDSKL